MTLKNSPLKYVVCINNTNYPASLELRKVYQVLPDQSAAEHHLLRVIDESEEDYLYPEANFVSVELPPKAELIFTSDTR